MVSLTTVYIVSVFLTSIAGLGSVFASDRLVGGSAPPSNIVQTEPEVPQELELQTD